MLDDLPRGHFAAIYADPPWRFQTWSKESRGSVRLPPYPTMTRDQIAALPVGDLAADDCVLFLWICWPNLLDALAVVDAWGFTYKTCAFAWIKADATQPSFLFDDVVPQMGPGYWTRANSEVCLLATRGKPKRRKTDVRQAIVEPRRSHSRKPDCVRERIERLVPGPYVELFARCTRAGWSSWGNEVGRFGEAA